MDPTRPVSPYSIRGIANTVGNAYQGAVGAVSNLMERARPLPNVNAAPAPTPVPAPAPPAAPVAVQPAPTIGGAISAIQQRQQMLQGLANGGQVRYPMQHGGMIPGSSPHPGADNIPVNATAGEYMLPVDTTEAVGRENLDALVASTHMPLRGPGRAARGNRAMAVKYMRNGGRIGPIDRGGFHRWLGKPEDQPITQEDIAKGLSSTEEHVRKMAQFAKNASGWNQGGAHDMADGGPVTDEDRAVFGLFPQLAGGRRTTYATDAALRTGVQATGPDSFQPAARLNLGGQRGLPAGVPPSTAGAGRGVVNPEPALSATPQPQTSAAGAAPARRFVDAQGNPIPEPTIQPVASPDMGAVSTINAGGWPSSADRIATMQRAGQTYREIAAMQNAGANLPAGYGASVMPDRQAERNARFDREVAVDQASRIGGRGAARIIAGLEAQDRIAAEQTNTATREAGAISRLATSEAGADRRATQSLDAQERREGPLRAAQATEATVKARGAVKVQQAQDAYQQAVAGGDAKAIQKAEDNLRAAQGKWEKTQPERFAAVAVPGGVDPGTGMATGSSVVIYNQATGDVSRTMPAGDIRGGARQSPAVGTVQGGFRFKGGNPADPKSWERA